MKNYVEINNQILEEWKKHNEEFEETNFADDGIMYRGEIVPIKNGTERYSDEAKENRLWNDAPLRILFLTKDQNAGEYEAWDVRGETGDLSYAFFRNLMYQLYGLIYTKPGQKADYNFTNEKAIELYSTYPIARINAKKEAGASSVSNYTLRRYIERDGYFLKRQIENLDADIIVCCGYSESIEESGNLLLNFLNKECDYEFVKIPDNEWIYYDEHKNKIAINNWHLSARISSEYWYEELTEAYEQFLSKHHTFLESRRK